MQLAAPLYTLFLGTDVLATQKEIKQEMKRTPASIRIRLKLLHYLCRVTDAGFIVLPCIQVIKYFQKMFKFNSEVNVKFISKGMHIKIALIM